MKNQDFATSFLIDATPLKVFNAINNVRGWWSENIEGDTDKLNGKFDYRYEDAHTCEIEITEFVPNKRVVWKMLNNYFKFTKDTVELTGSHVIFDITEKEGKTQLVFTHEGLKPLCECYQICHDAWEHYIQDSLKTLILTGKGKATPKESHDDIPIINDNIEQVPSFSIYHRLLIKQPVEKVYEALTTQKGLAGWWTPETIATPEVGSIIRFDFGPDDFCEVKVEALKAYGLVKWRCIKSIEEWVGTTMTFELIPHLKGAILRFEHAGWKTRSDGFASCSYDWALFLRSLKFLCETGKGFPYPGQNG